MIENTQCESLIKPAYACVNDRCPEQGCKPCRLVATWFMAQDKLLSLTIREAED